MLLVLVGGRHWKGSGKRKSKEWGIGWRENLRSGGWPRGQGPQSKGKVRFELPLPPDQDEAFFLFGFSLHWHLSFSPPRFILLHHEPFICLRGCAGRYSPCRGFVILSASALWSLIRRGWVEWELWDQWPLFPVAAWCGRIIHRTQSLKHVDKTYGCPLNSWWQPCHIYA